MGVAAKLEVLTGDRTGVRHDVPNGATVRVGRVAPAELLIPDDPLLSALHFAVECRDGQCRVKDLGSRFGTFRRGERVQEADLLDGDEIHAGRSRFGVALRDDGEPVSEVVIQPPIATPPPVIHAIETVTDTVVAPKRRPLHPAVRKYLAERSEPLYAILDAAREPSIPGRLAASGEYFQTLFEGDRGTDLAPYGPWLVRLPQWSEFLEQLITDGWGHSWGVFFTCDKPWPDVRKHLRRFLMVKLPDGRQVFFRYYDPRVLRTYLQKCTPAELTEFFGPIGRYLAESADSNAVLEFTPGYKDWRKVSLEASHPDHTFIGTR